MHQPVLANEAMRLHSSALAFAPTMAAVAPTTSRSSAVSMAYENELGATGPLGMSDPLGLVSASWFSSRLRR